MNGLELFDIELEFDITDFYPSISKAVLIDSINYAKNYVEITDEQYQIILACRKTVMIQLA